MKKNGKVVNATFYKEGRRIARRFGWLGMDCPNERQLNAIGAAAFACDEEPSLWGSWGFSEAMAVARSRVFEPCKFEDPLPALWGQYESGEGYLYTPGRDLEYLQALEMVGATAWRAMHRS